MDKKTLIGRNTVEENRAAMNKALWKSEEERRLVESMQKSFGVDIRDGESFPVMKEGFSFKSVAAKLREADSATAFPQVLRAGVQSIVNSMYATVPTTHEQWTHTVTSSKMEELYAPLHGVGFPSAIGEQEVYPEVGAAGLDIRLKNVKWGTLFPVAKELLEDDQTGQFQKQVGLLGQYAKQVLEVWAYGKLASVAGMSYAGMSIPVSETKPADEASYPWSTSLIGGGATRPAAYGTLNQGNIQSAYVALLNQKNLLGLKMNVQPDKIIVGPKKSFDLATLLHSQYYPTGATPGSVGGAFSINPMQSLAESVVTRFLFDHTGAVTGDSSAWYMLDSKVPAFVVQVREAAVVEVESPVSGMSFDRDVIRFKLRVRGNADFIDPRYFFQGNDGSIA
jgi:hypothetical protein